MSSKALPFCITLCIMGQTLQFLIVTSVKSRHEYVDIPYKSVYTSFKHPVF
jgi:hypothetical protein